MLNCMIKDLGRDTYLLILISTPFVWIESLYLAILLLHRELKLIKPRLKQYIAGRFPRRSHK